MKKASQIRRLCTLRKLEEQHRASLLEEAKQRLQQIDVAIERSGEQRVQGRVLITESIVRGSVADRVAGLEEIECAKRKAGALRSARTRVEEQLRLSRDKFLSKRMERRQAEAVLDASLQEEAWSVARKSQSELDDWHRMAHRQPASIAAADKSSGEASAT